MGFYLAVTNRLPVLAGALSLAVGVPLGLSGCAMTTSGTATPAAPIPPAVPETLASLLLSDADVSAALSGDVVMTREVAEPWNDSAAFDSPDCLAVAGAAQRGVYDGSGWTAMRGRILREAPAAGSWSHFAVQAVVLFPTAQSAADFFSRSQRSWAGCSDRELTYAQQPAPDQVWSVGPAATDRGVLTLSRSQRSPQQWACQRALTVRGDVAVDIEACSLEGPTTAAESMAAQIGERLPSA